MDSHVLQDFQSELTCSICMNYFLEPVTIDCGHSSCRPCLFLCWEEAQTPMCCPECKEIVENSDFRTSIMLKKLASLARQATPPSDPRSGEQLCRTHGEKKWLFCEVDKSLLCSLCSDSPEHAVHSYSPVAWAAEEYRWYLCNDFLFDLCFESVTGIILSRIEFLDMEKPKPVNPELSSLYITGILDMLNKFRGKCEANCHVFLYGELRSVNVGCDPQGASLVTPTSECFLAWGTQTFATGRYYWEVEVGDSWNWALGVCNDYWKKNRNYKTDEVEGLFLLGCVKEGSHCTLFTTCPLVLQYVPRPIGRIGVFLDYEGGAVSFINVAQSSLIHSILSCSFSPRVNPVFCCSHI
uniref:Tripartite motif-containing protein 5 n=1 Tax=Spermophilus dauricus TaxID=99837 RepID=A0A8C9URN0_SPEDA